MNNKISKFFTSFNKVKFDDIPHKYYVNGKCLISVTELISKYTEEFDENYWSEIKANEFGLEQWEVIDAWKFINKKATLKGSIVHNYGEYIFNNKIFTYPKQLVLSELGYDPIYNEYIIQKNHIDKLYLDYKYILIPIKTEYVLCDEEYGIGGMVDLLVYNLKEDEYQIWDYKTHREFTEESERYLLGRLGMIEASDLEICSLQLSTYKYIIEKNTKIKIGKCNIIWLPPDKDDTYKIYEAKDKEYYVKIMLEENKLLTT